MAEKTVTLELKLDASGAANSVGDLKKSIVDLKNQALRVGEDTPLGRQFIADAGKAKDRLGDLTKQVDSFQDAGSKFGAVTKLVGSLAGGFQAAQGAAALFGSSGEDLQKVLVKVQAATALAQGAQALAGITDEIGAVKKIALAAASNVAGVAAWLFGKTTAASMAVATAGITVVIGAVVALISYFASAGDASEELAKKEEKRKDKAKKDGEYLTQLQQRDLDNAQLKIELLKKEGAAEEKIIQAQNELLDLKIKNNKAQQDLQDTTDEGQKRFDELVTEAKKLQNEKILLNTKEKKSVEELTTSGQPGSIAYYNDLLSKSNERLNKLVPGSAAYNAELTKNIKLVGELAAAQKIADDLTKKPEELQGKELKNQQASVEGEAPVDPRIKIATDLAGNLIAIDKKFSAETDEQVAKRKAIRQKELDDQLAKRTATIAVAQGVVTGLAAIGSLVIKNADKAAKFQKKIAVAQLLVDTASGISSVVAQASAKGFPAAIPIIIGGIAMVLGNMAKAKSILSKAGDVSVPSLDAGGAATAGGGAELPGAPTLNQPTTDLNGANQTNQPPATQVYVTETDIKRVGNRVNVIEARARFG